MYLYTGNPCTVNRGHDPIFLSLIFHHHLCLLAMYKMGDIIFTDTVVADVGYAPI